MRCVMALCAVVVLIWSAGCGAPKDPSRQADEILMKARTFVQNGDVDSVTKTLEGGYSARALRGYQTHFLQEMVMNLVATGRVDAAKQRVELAVRREPAVSLGAMAVVVGNLVQQGKHEELARWCSQLAALKPPKQVLAEIGNWQASAWRATGKFDKAVEAVISYLPLLAPAAGRGLAERQATAMIQEKQFDGLALLLETIEKKHAGDIEWRVLRIRMRNEAFLAQGQYEEAMKQFRTVWTDVPDESLAQIFNSLAVQSIRGGKRGLADEACALVVAQAESKPATRDAAARLWISTSVAQKDSAGLLKKLSSLLGAKLSAGTVIQMADSAYGAIMEKKDKGELTQYVAICEKLMPEARDDREKASLRGNMLDGSFCAGDYAKTLQLLEAGGLPGQDQKWLDMMVDKIKAHQALKEGRKDEAILRFRKFMDYVKAEAKDQVDPVSGERVTTEAVLGLNEKRIGDILAETGKAEEAKACYKKAAEYYQAALAKESKGSAEYRRVEEELKTIPAGP